MSLNVGDAKDKLQPYMLRYLSMDQLKLIWNSEFVAMLNTVANDLNKEANIHTVRYYKKTTANINYYEMPGDIMKMLLFIYKGSYYQDQWYAITRVSGTPYNSLIVLKDTPTTEIQMDIRFLRHIIEVTDDSDEVDLPDKYLSEFLDLMRVKIRCDFGSENPAVYDSYLSAKAMKLLGTIDPEFGHEGIRSWWPFDNVTDDSIYDITEHRTSDDSIQANDDGTYTWVT